MVYRLKVGSVTNAQRARACLNKAGYSAHITRVNHPSKEEGCGYAVSLQCTHPEELVRLLGQKGISVIGVDRE